MVILGGWAVSYERGTPVVGAIVGGVPCVDLVEGLRFTV